MTTTLINPNRAKQIQKLRILKGHHFDPLADGGGCIMDLASWQLAGVDQATDTHPCISPVIGTFLRHWNDSLPSDEDRDRLLRDLIPLLPGTASTPEVEQARALLALDWHLRVSTPTWLSLVPELVGIAEEMRAMPVVTIINAGDFKDLNRRASSKAAAARDAAGAAAGGGARDAAWAAARAAAWAAAWAAAGAADGEAAGAAAWAAARDAARAAARDALNPTILELQTSALNLVHTMISLTGVPA